MIASGKPIATTVSDSQGTFKIINVPAGSNIPLVFQLGKWRREIILPTVTACQDNPITDANLTRLPRNRQEGELPRIAVTTGVCDQVGCLLPRLGIDLAELGVAGDDKAVAFYQQVGVPDPSTTAKPPPDPFGPPNMRKSTELWNDEAELGRYDMTLLSSECGKALYNKSDAAFAAMTNYLAKGGRILSTDLSYVWLRYSPDPALAAVGVPNLGGPGDSPMILDTSFPKAKALADWMKFVDPAVTYGQISSDRIFNNVESVMPTSARTWASSPTTWKPCQSGPCPRIITVNTPVGVPASNQCGRALHLDFQVTNIVTSSNEPGATFPQNCGAADLGKNEEIAAFLFFDLASCIQDDLLPIVTP